MLRGHSELVPSRSEDVAGIKRVGSQRFKPSVLIYETRNETNAVKCSSYQCENGQVLLTRYCGSCNGSGSTSRSGQQPNHLSMNADSGFCTACSGTGRQPPTWLSCPTCNGGRPQGGYSPPSDGDGTIVLTEAEAAGCFKVVLVVISVFVLGLIGTSVFDRYKSELTTGYDLVKRYVRKVISEKFARNNDLKLVNEMSIKQEWGAGIWTARATCKRLGEVNVRLRLELDGNFDQQGGLLGYQPTKISYSSVVLDPKSASKKEVFSLPSTPLLLNGRFIFNRGSLPAGYRAITGEYDFKSKHHVLNLTGCSQIRPTLEK